MRKTDGRKLPKGITLRSDGRYCGTVQYCGERHYVIGKTPQEVRKKRDDLRYELEHGIFCKPDIMTLSDWFSTWMNEYKQKQIKPTTEKKYSGLFETHVKNNIGKVKLGKVTAHAIQKLINSIEGEGKNATARAVYILLNEVFSQALVNGLISRNPMAAVSIPRKEEKPQDEKRVLSKEEQEIFKEYAVQSKIYCDLYTTLLQTGMRINEACGLEWACVDFKKHEILVRNNLCYIRGEKRFLAPPKSKTSRRSIPLLPDVERLFRARRKQQLEERMMLGASYKVEKGLEDLVFTYPEGGAFWDECVRNDLKKVVEAIQKDYPNFEPLTPHTLRHTFATRCAEAGMPLQVLKTILGHSSLAMTADLYSHVLPDTKQEEMQKAAAYF